MKKSRFTEEQVIGILKRHEAGVKTAELCREHGISAATFYAWKSKYDGMQVAEVQRLKGLEDENRRRKRKRVVRDRAAEPRLLPPNQEWAMDFIVDGLVTGRMVRILSVVDAYTRERLALEADLEPRLGPRDACARAADRGAWQAGSCSFRQWS